MSMPPPIAPPASAADGATDDPVTGDVSGDGAAIDGAPSDGAENVRAASPRAFNDVAAGGVRIRAAVAADAAAIHAMLVAIAATTGDAGSITSTPADLARYGFGAVPAFSALIAEDGGRPVGLCLFFTTFSTWRGRPGIYVQDLYVDAAVRGGGLGRRLLAAAVAAGWRQGATHLRLSVDAGNAAAQVFYRRVGFAAAAHECIEVLDGAAFAALAEAGDGDDGGADGR